MGGWDVYCALCGGPFGVWWDENDVDDEEIAEYTYDPAIFESANDPELEWLEDGRLVGETPFAGGEPRVWVSGKTTNESYGTMVFESSEPGQPPDPVLAELGLTSIIAYPNDDSDGWAVPFHNSCRELFCQYMRITVPELRKDIFLHALINIADSEGYRGCLGIDYGDIAKYQEQYWEICRGAEHFVCDPVDIKGLRAFWAHPPLLQGRELASAKLCRTQGDPFAKLSPEILLLIISHFGEIKILFEARKASPAFANLELLSGFWKARIPHDMPWLWDCPSFASLENSGTIDWEHVYRRLWWGSEPSAKTTRIPGLCNRRRIWVQLLPNFAAAYEQSREVLAGRRPNPPTALRGAHADIDRRLIHPKPSDEQWETAPLLDHISDLRTAEPVLFAEWASDGHLAKMHVYQDASQISTPIDGTVRPRKEDHVLIAKHDWLMGFVVTSRGQGHGMDVLPKRQVVGLTVLFAHGEPQQLGSADGDKRLLYVNKHSFIVGLKMQGNAHETFSSLVLLQQSLSKAPSHPRLIDARRNKQNHSGSSFYLWRHVLPPAGLRVQIMCWRNWGNDDWNENINVSPMETLLIATSKEEESDITSISVDIRLGGIEVNYNNRASRILGHRRHAMRSLTIDGRNGEKITSIGWIPKQNTLGLEVVTNKGRSLMVFSPSRTSPYTSSAVWQQQIVSLPYGLFGYWDTGKVFRGTCSVGLGVLTEFKFDEPYRQVTQPVEDGDTAYWQAAPLPQELTIAGPFWGPPDSAMPKCKNLERRAANIPVFEDSLGQEKPISTWNGRLVNWVDCRDPLLEVRVTLTHGRRGAVQVPITAIAFKFAQKDEVVIGPDKFPMAPECSDCGTDVGIVAELEEVPHYRHETWQVGGKSLTALRIWRLPDGGIAAIQMVAEGQRESPIWRYWGFDTSEMKPDEVRFAGHGGGMAVGLKLFLWSHGVQNDAADIVGGETIIAGIQALKLNSNVTSESIVKSSKHSRQSSEHDQDAPNKQAKMGQDNDGQEAHQFQAGKTTHREEDQWKHRAPYRVHDKADGFDVKWKGKCHCGRVQYQLSREKPLSSKYCHCTTCQRLHAAPFQWATIFHKEDINFTNGHHDLGWYDSQAKSTTHHLPCKVSCAYCRTPIMDEGRNMILLFPTLIEGINTEKGREAFKAECHMFYSQRVVDFHGDGAEKWSGMQNDSKRVNDDGEEIDDGESKEEKKKD
ncbi:hypothetical protein HJFPF1_11893 [Paramyrothecium foliicola]|nr:hypothetical protein HJFPF1_11893 [Paramyrothecium foliicola]